MPVPPEPPARGSPKGLRYVASGGSPKGLRYVAGGGSPKGLRYVASRGSPKGLRYEWTTLSITVEVRQCR